ncbi:T9SS type A sorting domain-containing protein [bacterium]|nr:T9SS type A sorting domain-containing protein [bacterium]
MFLDSRPKVRFFELPARGQVAVKVYDVDGRLVATLLEGIRSAGVYSVQFDSSDLSSGMYFVRSEYMNQVKTRKMLLLK